MVELKPCAHCGAKTGDRSAPLDFTDDEGANPCHVYCWNCGAQGPSRPTVGDAIAAWNTRSSAHPSDEAATEARGEVEWGTTGYAYDVMQNGDWQAGGEGEDFHRVRAEATHYGAMYGQDGPVEILMWETARRPLSPLPIEGDPA